MLKILENNFYRQSLRMGGIFIIGWVLNYFFSFSHGYWLLLASMVVMVTPAGSTLYQGLQNYLYLMVLVIIYSYVSNRTGLYPRCYDVTIGASLGIAGNILLLPRQINREFSQAACQLLQLYATYLRAIFNCLGGQATLDCSAARQAVEQGLLQLPSWVYAPGFDTALQAGHRYFLMKLTQISEILFAMAERAQYPFSNAWLTGMEQPLAACLTRIVGLIAALITVLQLQPLYEGVEDFAEDIAEIEAHLKLLLPPTVEQIALDREALYLLEFVYLLKELRNTLVRLAKAVR